MNVSVFGNKRLIICCVLYFFMKPDANSEESLLRQDFAKELGSSMASMSNFDANDLFSSDAFKSDLPIDPIDFDGLQILTDITDSQSDDNFRLSS